MAGAGMGAGLAGLCAVRRLGVELAAVTASVRRVWGRHAVAIVAVLAAACVCVPAAQAWSTTMQIAFQANTGNLWNWTINDPGSATAYGMAAGTSPSEAPIGLLSNHEIAFQANTGALWTTGAGGQGATPLWDGGRNQPEHRRFGDRVSGRTAAISGPSGVTEPVAMVILAWG